MAPTFEDLLTPRPYRWPRKGDRLLVESLDWDSGAGFPDTGTARHVFIWGGFMQAGERLIDSIGPDDFDREPLLFPILANYRHAVELGLKWLLTQYGPSLGIDSAEVDEARHNLWRLWQLLRPVIEMGAADAEQPGIDAAEQLIKDLHELDESAMVLRYWQNKNHESFKLPQARFDLANIKDVMKGLSNFLDGVDGQLDDLAGAQP